MKKNLQKGCQPYLGRDLRALLDEWGHLSLDYDIALVFQAVVEKEF